MPDLTHGLGVDCPGGNVAQALLQQDVCKEKCIFVYKNLFSAILLAVNTTAFESSCLVFRIQTSKPAVGFKTTGLCVSARLKFLSTHSISCI